MWNGNVLLHEWTSGQRYEDKGWKPYEEDFKTWIFEESSFVPLALLQDGHTYSIMTDHLGTPTEMYDENGEEVWYRRLDMNGKIIKEECHRRTSYYKNVTVPFLFQGQYYDYETELAYNRFRYYSPNMGCYISQDPIGLLGGIRLYGYVKNTNTWIDVLGLFPVEKLADSSVRTKSSYNKATIYKITKKVELDGVKFQKGDYYYLDSLHKDHIETFSKNNVSKGVFNLDGTYNDKKSEKAKKRKGPGYRG